MARERARRRGRKTGGEAALAQLPWRRLENPYRPIEVLDDEGIAAICDTAYSILEEIGMDFLHPEALAILRRAGAEVEPGGERVRFDRGLIEEAIAPRRSRLRRRDPSRAIGIPPPSPRAAAASWTVCRSDLYTSFPQPLYTQATR